MAFSGERVGDERAASIHNHLGPRDQQHRDGLLDPSKLERRDLAAEAAVVCDNLDERPSPLRRPRAALHLTDLAGVDDERTYRPLRKPVDQSRSKPRPC